MCANPPAPAVPVGIPGNDAKRAYQHISWQDVELLAADLVRATRNGAYDVVIAITRGGLTPAALVAEGLGIRTVLAATVMLYTDAGDEFYGLRGARVLAFPAANLLEGRRVLIIDDVWDSGRTAASVAGRARRTGADCVAVAVLHYKPKASAVDSKPDFFADTTELWIVYPWEQAAATFANTQ